jgi:hypothetical protein
LNKRNSKKLQKTGKANTDQAFRSRKTIFLVSKTINANIKGSNTVKKTANGTGKTVSK